VKLRVIGTAGHVDHGKSTLIKALTGIDPDRLKEEKEREMTIDLGFAWLSLPSGEQVGVVDVPGHQDFIKNMLAGIGGIDAAMLVIAANESVMPQTREHLAILDLLQAPAAVIALTKTDLAESSEWIELVKAEISELVQGTRLETAPVVPVSALTGAGLDQLVHTLDQLLQEVPRRPDRGRPRLPVDRVFSIAGFGTVITGTLVDGTLHVGQEVEIQPSGLKARIRGLQSHKEKIETAVPGSRVAVNLTRVAVDEVHRGEVLTIPGWLLPTSLVDVRLDYLPDASHPLQHNRTVEFFSGTSQVMAAVRLLGIRTLVPGETGWAQLRLASPVPLVKGDHFIIRQPSPSITIGGGIVLDPLPRRQHRRFRPDVIARLQTLAEGSPAELVLEYLDREGPTTAAALAESISMTDAEMVDTLQGLLSEKQVFTLPVSGQLETPLASSSQLVSSQIGWQNLLSRINLEIERFHTTFPLRPGMPREELKSRLKLDARTFSLTLAAALSANEIIEAEGTIRHPSFEIRLSPTQQESVDQVLKQFRAAPYTTPSYKEVSSILGAELIQALISAGQLVRLGPDVLLLHNTYQELVQWVKRTIGEQGSVNVAAVRDAFQTSRKYALALLEHLDDQRITRRVGDERVLR
jgi:selenocysteine-specific elongation factor